MVVTIVILIILAGVTLSLVLGSNGILIRAREAKTNYTNAAIEEQNVLNSLADQIDSYGGSVATPTTVATAIGTEWSATSNTVLTDDNGETVTVPGGFKIASDSATNVSDGIVIEDADGNQFVWIPVASISDYKRTAFSDNIATGTIDTETNSEEIAFASLSPYYFTEAMPSDEQMSITTYGGYYIGRYEAGDKESTANKVMRDSSVTTDTVTIKKGQAPYNYVTRDQAITLAEGIDTAEGYTTATTKLCSSYAWDTAISFIQKTLPTYGSYTTRGNYNDTTFIYTDITGASQTKELSAYVLTPTGQTTPACNIYDMGGNEWEWTTETSSSYPYVYRGGDFGNVGSASNPAGCRSCSTTTASDDDIGFRITLYM